MEDESRVLCILAVEITVREHLRVNKSVARKSEHAHLK